MSHGEKSSFGEFDKFTKFDFSEKFHNRWIGCELTLNLRLDGFLGVDALAVHEHATVLHDVLGNQLLHSFVNLECKLIKL